MEYFRCYFLTPDNHIFFGVDVTAEAPEDAVKLAIADEHARKATTIEVWSGATRLLEKKQEARP